MEWLKGGKGLGEWWICTIFKKKKEVILKLQHAEIREHNEKLWNTLHKMC